jgi:hypothetical protein
MTRPLSITLVLAAAFCRLIPHPPNLTPLGGLGLFAGARLSGWQAFAVPFLAMAISDVALLWLFDYPPFNPFVYGSIAINVLIGRWLANTEAPAWIGSAALVGSLQFFLITNFGVWLTQTLYPPTAAGLVQCYIAGLPFFANQLIGDLASVGVLFGLHAWLTRRAFAAERVRAEGAA